MKNIFVCDDFKVKSLCKIAKTNKHKQKKSSLMENRITRKCCLNNEYITTEL